MKQGGIQDTKRLAALKETGMLDTGSDPGFDQLAQTWARMLNVPIAMVSLVDAERHVVKSCTFALPEPYGSKRELPLSHSFCKHVVELQEALIVRDAREHPLLKDNPAIEELGAIAYAGLPLVTPEGQILG
jgi:GAF domain-containing protein